MTQSMKAAFVLTLEDKLTSGLKNIGKEFADLKRAGKDLNVGKLEQADQVLRTVQREMQGLTRELRTIEAAADRGWGALKRMASVPMQRLGAGLSGAANAGRAALGHGGLMGAAAAVGGTAAVLAPVHKWAEYQNNLKHSVITAGFHGADADREEKRLDLMFRHDANASGQKSESIAEAYREILQAGVAKELLDEAIGAHSRFATAYNVKATDIGQLSVALLKNAELTPDQYSAALGQTGQISKQGLFKVTGYNQFMPGITGQMKTMGMVGPEAVLSALSALQIVRRSTGDDSSAATDLRSLLEHIYAPIQERAMRMHGQHVPDELRQTIQNNAGAYKSVFGVDYPAYMKAQEKAGVNPLDAYLNLMRDLAKTDNFTDKMRIFGQLTHSEQQGVATQALISNHDDWMKMRADGRASGQEVFERDFTEAMRGASAAVTKLEEGFVQLERRIGEGFTPVLTPVNTGLEKLMNVVDGLDTSLPGMGNAVLTVTGSLIALGAALAALGFIAPGVAAGAGLLAAGVTAAAPIVGLPGIMLGAGAAQGAMNAPYVDEYGRVIAYPGATPDGAHPLSGSAPPINLSPPAPVEHKLDVNITTDPGTTATVSGASPGVSVKGGRPNPGSTTTLP